MYSYDSRNIDHLACFCVLSACYWAPVRTCFVSPVCVSCLTQATTVVFDKTGTLTTGKPTVTSVISIEEGWDRDRVRFGSLLGASPATFSKLSASASLISSTPTPTYR